MQLKIVIINLILILISCKNEKGEIQDISIADKTETNLSENEIFKDKLSEYIKYQEKDNLNNHFDFEILKAINEDDTTIISKLEDELSSYQMYEILDSTYHWLGVPSSLNQLDTSIKKAFRFHYNRSFDDKILMITVKSSLNNHWIENIEYEMPCSPLTNKPKEYNRDCLKIIQKKEFQLTEEEWSNLKKLIYKAEFWYLPNDNNKRGMDGSTWTIVGLDRNYNKHHYVFRWSPPKENDFREVCEYIMKISRIKIERIY